MEMSNQVSLAEAQKCSSLTDFAIFDKVQILLIFLMPVY